MTDPRQQQADKLDVEGEDPAAESGAGYGSHAPDVEDSGNSEDRSKNRE